MKSVAAILILACAVSGQIISPIGINRALGGLPLAYNNLGYSGLGINGVNLGYSAPIAYSAPAAIAPAPIAYSAPVVAASPVVSSQYHAQDELGQASFGYAHPGQASSNFRDAMGNQVGSYAYINPEGKEVKVSYVADSLGFRVLSNDLPVAPVAPIAPPMAMPLPVADTVEVVEARNAHMAAIQAARSGVIAAPVPVALPMPSPVMDTPEVAAAKAEHAAAHMAAKLRNKRQIIASPLGLRTISPLGLTGVRSVAPLGLAGIRSVAPLGLGYAAAPVVAAPAMREATLTQIVHNPGHAMSYRVD